MMRLRLLTPQSPLILKGFRYDVPLGEWVQLPGRDVVLITLSKDANGDPITIVKFKEIR